MSVVVETTLGDITIDLYLKKRPRACQNFLKLCKMKYYNYNLFHTVSRGFIAQTGDPTGSRTGGESIFGILEGPLKRFFESETNPRIKHTIMGLISFVGNDENMIGSQFFFTLGDELTYLDKNHCVFGEVVEGMDVLEEINEAICDTDDRPYKDIRITHTVILDDPLPGMNDLRIPSRSPSPSAERLQGGRIAPDEEIDETEGKSLAEINELIAEREAKARATILEMVGDLPDADMAPPENVLFVCKLNPVTTDDDLEIIFSRFGPIKSCEVIRDHKSNDSLQYAFVEFKEQKSCEEAYFKMDNVLIDDRRIHVDFSQSVSKIKWLGKGRGVRHFDDKGREKREKRSENKGKDKISESRNRRSSSKSPEDDDCEKIHKDRKKEKYKNDRNRSQKNKDDKFDRDKSTSSENSSHERNRDSNVDKRHGSERKEKYRNTNYKSRRKDDNYGRSSSEEETRTYPQGKVQKRGGKGEERDKKPGRNSRRRSTSLSSSNEEKRTSDRRRHRSMSPRSRKGKEDKDRKDKYGETSKSKSEKYNSRSRSPRREDSRSRRKDYPRRQR